MVRVCTNGVRHQGSISGRVTPKAQKMVLHATLLNTQHYKVPIKSEWRNPGKIVAPFPSPLFSSYWKRALGVAFNFGWPTYIYIYIYIYIYTDIYIYIYVCVCMCVWVCVYILKIYICVCVCVCVCVLKMRRSTKRFVFFKDFFFLFLYRCMFPACCFCQTIYIAQNLVNGALNETWIHSCLQFEWFSVGNEFICRSLVSFS